MLWRCTVSLVYIILLCLYSNAEEVGVILISILQIHYFVVDYQFCVYVGEKMEEGWEAKAEGMLW